MKPKMQLSLDVPVSDGFRAEINKWMVDFFGYETEEIEQIQQFNDANIVTRKPRKKRGEVVKTFGALLSNIEETFKLLEFDIDDVTFYKMLKQDVIGLKKCAPLVTDTNFLQSSEERNNVDVNKGLPSYFVISVNQGSNSDEHVMHPDFAFGMKVKKVPWNVTRLPGTVYLFGMAWRDGKKHIWHGFWLSVLPNGEIRVADELQNKYVTVAGSSYTKRVWEKSSWHGPQTNREAAVRHCFCETLNRYQERSANWNIGVSNGKKKITFLIPDNEAKDYFRERIKIQTPSGKTKPIIHFVKAHTQNHNGKIIDIPEHIRGLREFDWNGYHCTITAPKFHLMSTSFEAQAEYISEDEKLEGFVEIGNLADILNSLDDKGIRLSH